MGQEINYEFLEKIKNGEAKLKISIKSLTKKIDCTPENRILCHTDFKKGMCCEGHPNHGNQYHKNEIKYLPPEVLKYVDKNGVLKYVDNLSDKKNKCPIINICIKNQSVMPAVCALFPLAFNNNGRLIIRRMVWMRPCPFYGRGKPLYISMKDKFIELFGNNIYSKIKYMIENNIEEL